MGRRGAALVGLCASLAALVGCTDAGSDSSVEKRAVRVVAAFYPLEFAAEQVGGESVSVESLTPSGAEPHDVELSAQQVAGISEADLVLYIKGFQPAVDEAVAQVAGDRALDVSEGIDLLPAPQNGRAGEEPVGGGAVSDPHIWLDPLNMITIAATITDRLTQLRPDAAPQFTSNRNSLDDELDALDADWREGTAQCRSRDLVVSHEAFGYLAERYDFTQVGISGLTPDAEPPPSAVAEVADFVAANDVRTIYYETLVAPTVAETVAAETGAEVAVLDPLEGLAEGSAQTYLTVMRTNLDTVRAGQPCP